jgi:hypothetical protein
VLLRELLRQYGEAAFFHAAMKADEALIDQDMDAHRIWKRIVHLINEIEEPGVSSEIPMIDKRAEMCAALNAILDMNRQPDGSILIDGEQGRSSPARSSRLGSYFAVTSVIVGR